MKKGTVIWVCALMLLSSFLVLPAGTGADEGAGAPRAPTMIYNANDLQNMSVGLGNDYALGNDIDASATSGWNGGAGFLPVGTSSSRFSGTFDGKGYNITGLSINRAGMDYVGLFGYTASPAKISYLSIKDAVISGRNFVGGFAGELYYGTITGCSFIGVVKGANYVGGLAGYAYYGTITSSYSAGSVGTGGSYCGGIAGIQERTPISTCYSTASVAGNSDTGGLTGYSAVSDISGSYFTGSVKGAFSTGGVAGEQYSGSITNSYNTGLVQASSDRCGGLTGYSYGGAIYRSWNTGTVNGPWGTGGLSGWVESQTVINCYSTGPVSGSTYVGGLVGISTYSSVYYSFSTGFVKGSGNVGGMTGYVYSGSWGNDYWDYQSAGMSSTAAGTAKTTDEMKTQSTFVNWDFSGTWGIFGGTTYPYLLWRYPAALLLSGTAYSDAGITPLASGAPVMVVDHFGLSVAHFEGRTDYTGRYAQLVDSGAFLAAVTKTAVAGNSYGKETAAQSYVLDVYSKTILAKAAAGKTISVQDIEAVTTVFRTDQVLALTFSDRGLALPSGVPLATGGGTIFETDRNLTATDGAALEFNGKLSPTKDVLLNAGDARFNAGFSTARELTLNCTGDIVFRGATALGDLFVQNARDVLVLDALQVTSFTQGAGTGTTEISGGLDAASGNVSITTAGARGRIVAGSLSLGTTSAFLTGLVGGLSGQEGADSIELLGHIRIGTHFFDGIDLYMITPEDVPVATENEPYSVDYQPMDPANETLTWTIETGAGWLSMASAAGVLSGTPRNGDVGMHEVMVTAHDGPRSLSRTFMLEVLNVNDPPEILTANVETAMQGEAYSVFYVAMDIDPTVDELLWTFDTDAGWLNLDGNHLFGIPSNDDVGEYSVTITVSDGNGGSESHDFTLTVENVNDAPWITVEPVTKAQEDMEYMVEFNATDVDPDDVLVWSLETTADWLGIDNGTGVLSGTPSNDDIGSYWVAVTVEDREGASDSLGFMLTVVNVNDGPVWVTVPADLILMEGDALLLDVLASDVDKGDVIRYAISSTPASGLVINAASGSIRWTGVTPGSYVVTLTATDGRATIDHTFNLTVKALPPPVIPPPNNLPKIGTVTVDPARVGQAFAVKLNGSDLDAFDATNLTFRLVSGPSGMIVSADGNLLWIPAKDQSGSHTVTVALSDGKNTTTTVFTIEVKKPSAVAASTSGYNEGWLLAMVFLGLFLGVLVAFVLARRPPRAAEPAPAQQYPMAPLPTVELSQAPPAAPPPEPPKAPPAEPLPTLPPPEPAFERKPQPDFKP